MFPENAGGEHHGVLDGDVLLVRDDDVSCAVGLPTRAVTQYEPGELTWLFSSIAMLKRIRNVL